MHKCKIVFWLICFEFFIQVYSVVDEMFLAGEIRETSQSKVLKQLQMLQQLEWYQLTST